MAPAVALSDWYATFAYRDASRKELCLKVFSEISESRGQAREVEVRVVVRINDMRFQGVMEQSLIEFRLVGPPSKDKAELAGIPEDYHFTFGAGIPSNWTSLLKETASRPPAFLALLPPVLHPIASTSKLPSSSLKPIPEPTYVRLDRPLPASFFDLGTRFQLEAGDGFGSTRELAAAIRDRKGKRRAQEVMDYGADVPLRTRDEEYVRQQRLQAEKKQVEAMWEFVEVPADEEDAPLPAGGDTPSGDVEMNFEPLPSTRGSLPPPSPKLDSPVVPESQPHTAGPHPESVPSAAADPLPLSAIPPSEPPPKVLTTPNLPKPALPLTNDLTLPTLVSNFFTRSSPSSSSSSNLTSTAKGPYVSFIPNLSEPARQLLETFSVRVDLSAPLPKPRKKLSRPPRPWELVVARGMTMEEEIRTTTVEHQVGEKLGSECGHRSSPISEVPSQNEDVEKTTFESEQPRQEEEEGEKEEVGSKADTVSTNGPDPGTAEGPEGEQHQQEMFDVGSGNLVPPTLEEEEEITLVVEESVERVDSLGKHEEVVQEKLMIEEIVDVQKVVEHEADATESRTQIDQQTEEEVMDVDGKELLQEMEESAHVDAESGERVEDLVIRDGREGVESPRDGGKNGATKGAEQQASLPAGAQDELLALSDIGGNVDSVEQVVDVEELANEHEEDGEIEEDDFDEESEEEIKVFTRLSPGVTGEFDEIVPIRFDSSSPPPASPPLRAPIPVRPSATNPLLSPPDSPPRSTPDPVLPRTPSFSDLYEESDSENSIDMAAREVAEFVEREAMGHSSDGFEEVISPTKKRPSKRIKSSSMLVDGEEEEQREKEKEEELPLIAQSHSKKNSEEPVPAAVDLALDSKLDDKITHDDEEAFSRETSRSPSFEPRSLLQNIQRHSLPSRSPSPRPPSTFLEPLRSSSPPTTAKENPVDGSASKADIVPNVDEPSLLGPPSIETQDDATLTNFQPLATISLTVVSPARSTQVEFPSPRLHNFNVSPASALLEDPTSSVRPPTDDFSGIVPISDEPPRASSSEFQEVTSAQTGLNDPPEVRFSVVQDVQGLDTETRVTSADQEERSARPHSGSEEEEEVSENAVIDESETVTAPRVGGNLEGLSHVDEVLQQDVPEVEKPELREPRTIDSTMLAEEEKLKTSQEEIPSPLERQGTSGEKVEDSANEEEEVLQIVGAEAESETDANIAQPTGEAYGDLFDEELRSVLESRERAGELSVEVGSNSAARGEPVMEASLSPRSPARSRETPARIPLPHDREPSRTSQAKATSQDLLTSTQVDRQDPGQEVRPLLEDVDFGGGYREDEAGRPLQPDAGFNEPNQVEASAEEGETRSVELPAVAESEPESREVDSQTPVETAPTSKATSSQRHRTDLDPGELHAMSKPTEGESSPRELAIKEPSPSISAASSDRQIERSPSLHLIEDDLADQDEEEDTRVHSRSASAEVPVASRGRSGPPARNSLDYEEPASSSSEVRSPPPRRKAAGWKSKQREKQTQKQRIVPEPIEAESEEDAEISAPSLAAKIRNLKAKLEATLSEEEEVEDNERAAEARRRAKGKGKAVITESPELVEPSIERQARETTAEEEEEEEDLVAFTKIRSPRKRQASPTLQETSTSRKPPKARKIREATPPSPAPSSKKYRSTSNDSGFAATPANDSSTSRKAARPSNPVSARQPVQTTPSMSSSRPRKSVDADPSSPKKSSSSRPARTRKPPEGWSDVNARSVKSGGKRQRDPDCETSEEEVGLPEENEEQVAAKKKRSQPKAKKVKKAVAQKDEESDAIVEEDAPRSTSKGRFEKEPTVGPEEEEEEQSFGRQEQQGSDSECEHSPVSPQPKPQNKPAAPPKAAPKKRKKRKSIVMPRLKKRAPTPQASSSKPRKVVAAAEKPSRASGVKSQRKRESREASPPSARGSSAKKKKKKYDESESDEGEDWHED